MAGRWRNLGAALLTLAVNACSASTPAPTPSTQVLASPTAAVTPAPRTPSPSPSPSPRAPQLRFVAGSTQKIEQLIGDQDFETGKATTTQTFTRFGVRGTDLGQSFEHQGRMYFCFGDTIGRFGGDVVGVSSSTDPAQPLALDFVADAQGRYLKVEPDGKAQGGFEVPTHGISLGGVLYLTMKTNHAETGPETDVSILVRYDEQARAIRQVREISKLPGGRFIELSLRAAPEGLRGLPPGGPHVLMFGAGTYRKSDAYLAVIPAATFATGAGTRYFAGLAAGDPRWSEREADAVPIVAHPTIGEFGVVPVPQLGLWLMTYQTSAAPAGVLLRTAPAPWGPWSEPQIIFNAVRDGALGKYIFSPQQPGAMQPGLVIGNNDPLRTPGGAYAPFPIERFLRLTGDVLTLDYLLSTWNPYTVVRLRSTLRVER